MTGTLHVEDKSGPWRLARAAATLLLFWLARRMALADTRTWLPLAKDGIHDPKSPAIKLLQEPSEALSKLPGSSAGDKVLWGEAIQKGLIQPRSNIYPETKFKLRDTDILLDLNGSERIVRFPHKDHTLWLDCGNCHDKLFKKEAGANKYSMLAILNGEQCGVCHGAVAFPLTECKRCHNTPRGKARASASAYARTALGNR